jgi:hypothetical protein
MVHPPFSLLFGLQMTWEEMWVERELDVADFYFWWGWAPCCASWAMVRRSMGGIGRHQSRHEEEMPPRDEFLRPRWKSGWEINEPSDECQIPSFTLCVRFDKIVSCVSSSLAGKFMPTIPAAGCRELLEKRISCVSLIIPLFCYHQ